MPYKYELKDLDKHIQTFGSNFIGKASQAALNKTIARSRTFVSKSTRSVYNVNAAAVKRRVRLERARAGNNRAALYYTGPRVGLINFGAKEKIVTLGRKPRKGKGRPWGNKRVGATVKVLKKGKRRLVTTKPGFIATGNNGNRHVFARSGKSEKLVSLKTRSIPEMVADAVDETGSLESFNEFAGRVHEEEYDRAVNYYLGKQ